MKTTKTPTDDNHAIGIPLLLPAASKNKTEKAEKATFEAQTPTIARLEDLLLKNSLFFAPLVTEPSSGKVRPVERSVELVQIACSFAKYAHNLVDAQMAMAVFEAREEAMKEERRRRRGCTRSCSCAWMFPFPLLGYH